MVAVHRVMWVVLLVGVAVEFLLAGAGVFGATSLDPHRGLGVALLAAAAIALVAAVRAKRNLRLPTGLAALLAMQFLSGHFGADHPWLGALHGLTALAVGGVSALGARQALA